MVDRQKIFNEMLEEFHKLKWDHETGTPLSKQIGKDGREYGDDTPMAPPVGYKRQPTMVEIIREAVRNEKLQQDLRAAGHETFEEADDFDIGDDYDPQTPYENDFDPPIREVFAEAEASMAARAAPAPAASPPAGGGAPTPEPAPAPAPNPAPPPHSTPT